MNQKKANKKTKRNSGGDIEVAGDPSPDPSPQIVPVQYKVYAKEENGRMTHYVSISVEYDVPTARIDFFAKREDGKNDDELNVIAAEKATTGNAYNIYFSGMQLSKVALEKGSNMLKLQFSDNTKHSLTIDVRTK